MKAEQLGPLALLALAILVSFVVLVISRIARHIWRSMKVPMACGVAGFMAGGSYFASPAAGGGCALAAFLLGYLVSASWRRTTGCWWCGGQGRYYDGEHYNSRDCWWCGGKGRRPRLTARRSG